MTQFDWTTQGLYLKVEVVEKCTLLEDEPTVTVVCFYTEKRFSKCPNPRNEELVDALYNRHSKGFSTEYKHFKVPLKVLENKDSWIDTI